MNAIVVESSIKLLPCPFCGGEDLHIETDSNVGYSHTVICDNPDCEAEGPNGAMSADEGAIKWNTRRQPTKANEAKIRQYAVYQARVKIRRGEQWDIKPEMEALDGQMVTVDAAWLITGEDVEQYAGEWAMLMRNGPVAWIASGDLEDLQMKHGA